MGIFMLKLFVVILVSIFIGFIGGAFISMYYLPENITKEIKSRPFQKKIERPIILKTRRFICSTGNKIFDTEKDSIYKYITRQLDLDKMALVLIDVWKEHPNDGWMERANRHRKMKIVPLLELARKYGLTVIHAAHNQEIAEDCKPISGELIIDSANSINDTEEINLYLKDRGIKVLLYAGYASNYCILYRPVGIIMMRLLGYNIILVRDCTIAFEMPESLEEQWANKIAINTVEHELGETTTLKDLKKALKSNRFYND